MKYMGFGVEDFHCQDRGRTMSIFKWKSSTFKIDIDTIGQLLLNVETIERETNERFKNLANAFVNLKITLNEVKYKIPKINSKDKCLYTIVSYFW